MDYEQQAYGQWTALLSAFSQGQSEVPGTEWVLSRFSLWVDQCDLPNDLNPCVDQTRWGADKIPVLGDAQDCG